MDKNVLSVLERIAGALELFNRNFAQAHDLPGKHIAREKEKDEERKKAAETQDLMFQKNQEDSHKNSTR